MWRVLVTVLIAMTTIIGPAVTRVAIQSDDVCPSGTAQVVLDPGHGGSDTGALNSIYGLYEKSVNLEVAQRTAMILRETYGYRVALTREDNETELGNSQRGAIANACQALVFVEIHMNASSDPSVDYTQTFWGEKEKDLAFSQTMILALSALGIPSAGIDRFDNGGLLRARMPSVLVEAVFLSNMDEAKDLANGTRQEGISQAVATGVDVWIQGQA